jgi:hypothetical protein
MPELCHRAKIAFIEKGVLTPLECKRCKEGLEEEKLNPVNVLKLIDGN